jgi:uncharacterized membrane protein YjjP (DUF1212 family)
MQLSKSDVGQADRPDETPAAAEVNPQYLRAVADFAVEAGGLLLASGAAAAEVEQAMFAVAQQAGIDHVTVDVTYNQLTFSYHPDGEIPFTRIHTIHGRTFDYGKMTEVSHLVERFCRGQLTIGVAEAEVRRLATARGPYPWWLTRLATGFAGANAALVFGGGWLVMLAAFVANVVLDYLLGVLARHRWLSFYLQALAGCSAVLAAEIVHVINPTIDPSRVVVSVIIVMLAGMTSTGAVQDALTGWYLTALGRLFEAVMNTVGLLVGVAFGLLVADRLGLALPVTPNVSMGALPLPVMLVASAFVAIGFSFVAQNPLRIIVPTALLAAIGYAVFDAASTAQLSIVWASAAAAIVVGLIAIPYTQWFKAPAAAFAICAILPLLPGLSLFQGLAAIMQPGGNSIGPLVTALSIALALAGGLTFGEHIGIISWRRLRLVEDRFFAPLFAQPFATERGSGRGDEDEAPAD